VTSRLTAKLHRQIQDGIDPVVVFRELLSTPSVSFSEYLLYDYLVSMITDFRKKLPVAQRQKMGVDFTPAGQLIVRWRGRPDDPRKSVLISHVDTEGFLVREVDRSTDTALCWHTSGEAPEDDKVGSPVKLVLPYGALRGNIKKISKPSRPLTRDNPFDHEIVVRIEDRDSSRITKFERNPYFIGVGNYEIPVWSNRDGVISATHVDNTAGVSVLITLLMTAIKKHWPVNIDFLFTTCEEPGFCGIVSEILDGSVLNSAKDGEVVCIVVDSSSHVKFTKDEQLWNQDYQREPRSSIQTEVPLQDVVIRTGDGMFLFDPEVTKLLCSAALNVQCSATDRVLWAGRKRSSVSDEYRNALRSEQRGYIIRSSVPVGRLIGGWCEASPLRLEHAIRERIGAPPLNLRVGSLAIPIAHYRNSFNNKLQPEKCHQDSLRGACEILGEATRLVHRWPFGLRNNPADKQLPGADKAVDTLMAWHDVFSALTLVTTEWGRKKVQGGPAWALSE